VNRASIPVRPARPPWRRVECVAALLASLAVGAGCGSSGDPRYSLGAEPAELEFRAAPGDPYPPAAATVTVSFDGDDVWVDRPADAPWLVVDGPWRLSPGATRAIVYVGPNTTALASGDYTTVVRFGTGNPDRSEVVTRDIPVRYLLR